MRMASGMQRNSGMNEKKCMSNFNAQSQDTNTQSESRVGVSCLRTDTLTSIQNNLICFLKSLDSVV